jgi:hypothetical protein
LYPILTLGSQEGEVRTALVPRKNRELSASFAQFTRLIGPAIMRKGTPQVGCFNGA